MRGVMMEETIRLNKYIAECGVCSRRDADKLIESGRIYVNGSVAEMGCKVGASDEVMYEGRSLKSVRDKVVLAYNKPIGVTCTDRDEHAEVTVKETLDYPIPLHYAGRLDKDTEGLLLLTNDGDLIETLMRGAHGHEKEYIVKVRGNITDDIINRLSEGVYLKDLDVTTRPCKVERLGDNKLKIILTQGLNRQIKRMCMAVGLRVVALKRIRVANIRLGDIASGQYREIDGAELKHLYDIAEGRSV